MKDVYCLGRAVRFEGGRFGNVMARDRSGFYYWIKDAGRNTHHWVGVWAMEPITSSMSGKCQEPPIREDRPTLTQDPVRFRFPKFEGKFCLGQHVDVEITTGSREVGQIVGRHPGAKLYLVEFRDKRRTFHPEEQINGIETPEHSGHALSCGEVPDVPFYAQRPSPEFVKGKAFNFDFGSDKLRVQARPVYDFLKEAADHFAKQGLYEEAADLKRASEAIWTFWIE